MKNIRIGGVSFATIYALIVSTCYILPAIKYSVPYVPLALILLFTYCLTIHNGKINTMFIFPTLISSFGLAIMSFIIMRRGDLIEAINESIRELRFMAPAILCFVMIKKLNKKAMRIVFAWLSVVVLFICGNTINALNTNSMVARILASGTVSQEMANYRFQNVGGFEFCYAIGFVAVLFLHIFLQTKKLLLKMISSLVYIYLMYFIIRTQYMTLLLLSICISIIIVYLNFPKRKIKVILLLVIVALLIEIPSIMNYLGGLTNSNESILTAKFMQISQLFSGEDISVIGSRPELYSDAFQNFLYSPIWGNVTMINGNVIGNMDKCHSTLLGYLQGMGIIGGALFYYPIFKASKIIERSFKTYSTTSVYTWKCLLLMFILLSILNPIQYCFEICFILFLYIPCGIHIFSEAGV